MSAPSVLRKGAVEGFREVLHRAHRRHRIDDPVFGGDVDADRHAIPGQHFLPGDIERLALDVDDLHLDHAPDIPEGVHARLERADEDAVHEQQPDLAVHDRIEEHMLRLAGLADPAHQGRIDSQIGRRVDGRDLPRSGIGPQHELAVRSEHGMQSTVALDDRNLRASGADDGEVTRGHIRELVEQRLLVSRNEFRVLQVVPGDFQVAAPVGEPMLARHQDRLDLTLVEGDGTFIFLHEDALASKKLFENGLHCLTPVGHGLMRGVTSCVEHPFVSCFTSYFVSPARMIRGPVASIRGGPSGADRGAAKRAPETEASFAGRVAP